MLATVSLVAGLIGFNARPALADDVPAEAVVADIPFMNVPGSPRIHFDLAAPGDRPLPVMLDTGFKYALGSATAISKIGGKPLEAPLRGIERNTALGVPLVIQTSEIRGADAANHEWIRFGGYPLRPYIVELDFEKRRIRFIDREKYPLASIPEGPQRAIVPIRHMGFRPFAMIHVNDRETFVSIDTTVTLPLSIGPRNLAKAAVHPKTLPILKEKGTRRSNTRLFETDKVRIGPFEFGVLPVFVSPPGVWDELGASGAAMGLDLLENFKVRFDLEGREMWLERTRTTPVGFGGVSYAYTRKSGLFLGPIGHQWLVLGVLPGSPAEKSGFQPGDRLEREGSPFSDLRRVQQAVQNQEPVLIERMVDEKLRKLIAPTDTAVSPLPDQAAN
jgi:hypothetical protein